MTKPKEAKESKRGHYRKVECPFCHSMVGNLGNHVKLKHPAEAQQTPVTKETLLGQQKPPPSVEAPPVYYCVECKAKLRKGENPCWHCGAKLNWEGIA